MPTELRWLVSTACGSLHAADALLAGRPFVDRAAADAIADEARAWRSTWRPAGFPKSRSSSMPCRWPRGATRRWAGPRRSPASCSGRPTIRRSPQRLSRRFIALQAAFSQQNPQALEELELRSQPLREQWEARGAGLLATVGRLTEPALIVETADAILVQPVTGGGGAAHWLYNSVRMEAVLTNPIAELPEVAHLAWLAAQLQLDLPAYHGDLPRSRLIEVWQLAMIPPVLAGAEEVELLRNDPRTLAAALAAWTATPEVIQPLADWWASYQIDNPPWIVAIGALDRMLGEAASPESRPR